MTAPIAIEAVRRSMSLIGRAPPRHPQALARDPIQLNQITPGGTQF
jgi:hypothetical protein